MSAIKKRKADMILDEYEQDIEENLDSTRALSARDKNREISKLKSAARDHSKRKNKEKRITIRVYASDLERIREIAEEEGLPYQTLVTSILHKFSTGRLISKSDK